MVISPHADDAAAFCGATLAKFASQGWKVILVRVTDDCKDSVGLTMEKAKERNAEQLREAAGHMGVAEIVELGYVTDCLSDVSLVELREKIVYLFRKHRPYAVFSFDPFGLYEDNVDHIRVAQAVGEAFWVSGFDLHHSEHFQEGLEPFQVCERWLFARDFIKANYAEDITDFIKKKVDALNAHKEMMKNMFHRYILQMNTWGRRSELLERARDGDPKGLLEEFLTEQARAAAAEFNLGEGRLAEKFRLDRFGDLEVMFQMFSEKIPGAEEAPRRPGIDAPVSEG